MLWQQLPIIHRKPIYTDPRPTHLGQLFEVDNWIISQFVLKVLIPIVGYKPFPLPELQLMVAAVTYFKPTHLFDWGTHIGKAARIFWEARQAFNLNYLQYSIDLPESVDHPEHPHQKRGQLINRIPEINQIEGDGVTEAVRLCTTTSSHHPFFFLDGDHQYSTVKRELGMLIRDIPNPIILVHDTFMQDKISIYNLGPAKAIEGFHHHHPQYQLLETNLGLPGMSLLYPKGNYGRR